ncbi:hypothetical protein MLPM_0575 [Mycobacterium lepromatosis]|uniref:Uncharacterized protein n=1 Tax=Mycobacterium lepromatosis TaxID=480418 RepID=A0A0F4ERZ3_9MYCO|nr:hypothetical protein MLPM_0575 [Mycobacterium lepromatosis]
MVATVLALGCVVLSAPKTLRSRCYWNHFRLPRVSGIARGAPSRHAHQYRGGGCPNPPGYHWRLGQPGAISSKRVKSAGRRLRLAIVSRRLLALRIRLVLFIQAVVLEPLASDSTC